MFIKQGRFVYGVGSRIVRSSRSCCSNKHFSSFSLYSNKYNTGRLLVIPFQPTIFKVQLTTIRQKLQNMPEALQGQNWDCTADDIAKKTGNLIEETRKMYNDIGDISLKQVTFENTIKAIADSDCSFSVARNNIDFYQHVHPNKDLRDASTTADKKLSEFLVEISMRQDIYDRVVAVSKLPDLECSAEGRRLIERLIKLGQRNGLHLDKTTQDKIKEIKKRQTEIEIDFQKNLNEENEVLEFTGDELNGLPDDFIKSLEKSEDGKFKLTLKYPHYFPLMKKCSVANTRKRMETAFNSRCKEKNTPILTELVKLRAEKAKLLGFENHAAFVHDMRMAKHPSKVEEFTSSLAQKLKPIGEADLAEMARMKEKDAASAGETFDRINMWDLKYYMTKIEEEKYSVDQNVLKYYFPLNVVTDGLFQIYQNLLGLKYEEIKDPHVWHEDVALYAVRDAEDEGIIGHFFLDLHPREGKYGHAACFGLVPGCLKPDGSRQFAVAAMVANFTKPTEEAPSLLSHDEVETFFHEFGHVMHQICAEAEYEMFSGTSVERDFVEAPSQMLENWCWEVEPLRMMSKHYKDGTDLPADMIEALVKSRNANTGVFYLRQITLGTLDLDIHTTDSADVAKVYSDACDRILGIPATPGTCMPATFGHLAGGYDAQYYGYLWSEVFCFDMFYTRFKTEGIMSGKVGRDYRNHILCPGGSLDATEMLRNFLGREPNQDSFLLAKGLVGSKY